MEQLERESEALKHELREARREIEVRSVQKHNCLCRCTVIYAQVARDAEAMLIEKLRHAQEETEIQALKAEASSQQVEIVLTREQEALSSARLRQERDMLRMESNVKLQAQLAVSEKVGKLQ